MKKGVTLFLSIFSSALFAGPLHEAASAGDAGRVACLLAGTGMQTPRFGIVSWFTNVMKFCFRDSRLGVRSSIVNEKDENGMTALMIAAYNGHIQIVKDLLIGGALINEKVPLLGAYGAE